VSPNIAVSAKEDDKNIPKNPNYTILHSLLLHGGVRENAHRTILFNQALWIHTIPLHLLSGTKLPMFDEIKTCSLMIYPPFHIMPHIWHIWFFA